MKQLLPQSIQVFAALFLLHSTFAAPLPGAFTYQGRMDSGGSPARGLFDLQASLWDAASGGAAVAATLQFNAVPVTNGLFALTLEFGTNAFPGSARWLELEVRTKGDLTFTTLVPRQSLTPTPHALFASSSSNLLGQVRDAQLPANLARRDATNTFTQPVTFNTVPGLPPFVVMVTNKVVNLNADLLDNLDGSAYAQIAADQTFTGSNTFRLLNLRDGSGANGDGGVLHIGGYRANGDAKLIEFGDAGFVYLGERRADDTLELRAGRFYFNNGFVGIGVTNPAVPLEVVGRTRGRDAGLHSVVIEGRSTATSGTNTGVQGVTGSGDVQAAGVRGLATNGIGEASGVYGESAGGLGIGVTGKAAGGTGVYGESGSSAGAAVRGVSTSPLTGAVGVHGSIASGSYESAGVKGVAPVDPGRASGVRGESAASTGAGVLGVLGDLSGERDGALFQLGGGVVGDSSGSPGVVGLSRDTMAVYGRSRNGSGVEGRSLNGVGLFAQSLNGNLIEASGFLQNGIFGPQYERKFRVTTNGNVFAKGTFNPGGADFAELLPAAEPMEPGDVLAINDEGRLVRSSSAYQASVAGVYSTKPGVLGGTQEGDSAPSDVPLAVVGVVPVKVTDENGPIRPGNLLTASSTAGHAMRADSNAPIGTVIGKALSPHLEGLGTIRMLVVLQ